MGKSRSFLSSTLERTLGGHVSGYGVEGFGATEGNHGAEALLRLGASRVIPDAFTIARGRAL